MPDPNVLLLSEKLKRNRGGDQFHIYVPNKQKEEPISRSRTQLFKAKNERIRKPILMSTEPSKK